MDVQARSLDGIPREVLVRILHGCDYIAIIRFSLTCKRAYNVVSSSVSLQLHIELEINGFEISDASSEGNTNYSLILKELKDYQDAWHNLRFGPIAKQQLRSSDIEVPNWGYRNGTYYGDFRVSVPSHDEDFLVDRTQFVTLGTLGIPPPTDFETKFGFCIADPVQDLAVLVEDEISGSDFVRFHFRSAKTGRPHPLAEHHTITARFDPTFLRENELLGELISATPEIMANCFAVHLEWRDSDCDASEILLWDWKSGALITRIYSEYSTVRYMFLDKDHLIVYSILPENELQSTRLALLVYHIPNLNLGYKAPPNADFCPSLYPKHSPVLIFELPELHPSWTFIGQHDITSSELLPGDVVYTKSRTILCSRVTTFSLGFRIWDSSNGEPYRYGSRAAARTSFRVFVNTNNLFVHLLGCRSEGITNRTIPWSQWGTAATRWFTNDLSVRLYGSQYARSTASKLGEGQLVSIVNFNPPVIKRCHYIPTTTSRANRAFTTKAEEIDVLEGKELVIDHPSQTITGSINASVLTVEQALNREVFVKMVGSDIKTIIRNGFKDSVVSCLPYRTVTKMQQMPNHGHWRIHGQFLIGVPRRDFLPGASPTVSLYKLDFPSQSS